MIKRILGLAVFFLVAHAAFRGGLMVFHDEQFKDAVREIALFGAGKSDQLLKDKVMDAAAKNAIPLDADYIDISRRTLVGAGDHVVIKVSYAVMVQLEPGYRRRFDFDYATP